MECTNNMQPLASPPPTILSLIISPSVSTVCCLQMPCQCTISRLHTLVLPTMIQLTTSNSFPSVSLEVVIFCMSGCTVLFCHPKYCMPSTILHLSSIWGSLYDHEHATGKMSNNCQACLGKYLKIARCWGFLWQGILLRYGDWYISVYIHHLMHGVSIDRCYIPDILIKKCLLQHMWE